MLQNHGVLWGEEANHQIDTMDNFKLLLRRNLDNLQYLSPIFIEKHQSLKIIDKVFSSFDLAPGGNFSLAFTLKKF